MREELQKLGSQDRFRFQGNFERFGTKRGWQGVPETTILLKEIKEVKSGRQVAGHLWFNLTGGFENAINACLGTSYQTKYEEIERRLKEKKVLLEFDGRVENYEKGWQGRKAEEEGEWRSEKDWKISRPTKITIRGC